MTTTDANVLTVARLSEKGQLTIPAEYRRLHDLERDSMLALIQMGDALVLVPLDEALEQITERLASAMRGAGVSVEDLISEAQAARAEIVREEFGEASEE
jgi:bifunctional DNA-binding transcriptional regulator/antitoxin component of YhaV-PrlF toxin-antitoxin module